MSRGTPTLSRKYDTEAQTGAPGKASLSEAELMPAWRALAAASGPSRSAPATCLKPTIITSSSAHSLIYQLQPTGSRSQTLQVVNCHRRKTKFYHGRCTSGMSPVKGGHERVAMGSAQGTLCELYRHATLANAHMQTDSAYIL